MANPLAITLLEHQQLTADGEGSAVDIGTLRHAAQVTALVSAISPSGPAALAVETRPDEDSSWRAVDYLTITGTGRFELAVADLDRFVRLSWELGQATSLTLQVIGEAHVVYCDPQDIYRFSMPERGLEDLTESEKAAACIAATDEADGYLNSAYRLPLTAWSQDLRKMTARIAGADLLAQRGVDPEGADAVVFQREEKAHEWLNRLANGRLKPPGIIDQTPETFEGGSVVVSRPKRGW